MKFQSKHFLLLTSYFLLLFSVSSCEKIIPPVEIPSYIHIDSIDVKTDFGTQGTSSHRITDAWVFVDEQPLGTFKLPCTFPVLAEGKHVVTIMAGIMVNGIAMSRAHYPMYAPYEQTVNLVKDSVVKMKPIVNYYSGIVFAWMENFDNTGITLTRTSNDSTVQIQTIRGDSAFEGNGSAFISLNSNNTLFECASLNKFVLPKSSAVYLELNFKCNTEFSVGIIANTMSQSYEQAALTLNPTTLWKKIYINLNNVISSYPDAGNYQIYFKIENNKSITNPQVYLDNIKLVRQ